MITEINCLTVVTEKPNEVEDHKHRIVVSESLFDLQEELGDNVVNLQVLYRFPSVEHHNKIAVLYTDGQVMPTSMHTFAVGLGEQVFENEDDAFTSWATNTQMDLKDIDEDHVSVVKPVTELRLPEDEDDEEFDPTVDDEDMLDETELRNDAADEYDGEDDDLFSGDEDRTVFVVAENMAAVLRALSSMGFGPYEINEIQEVIPGSLTTVLTTNVH